MPPPGFEPGTSRSLIVIHTTEPSNIGDETFSYKDKNVVLKQWKTIHFQ